VPLRQPTVFFHPLAERGPVRCDRLVQHSLFRSAPLVGVASTASVRARVMGSSKVGHPAARASRVPKRVWSPEVRG
jgi:hypothetical protein